VRRIFVFREGNVMGAMVGPDLQIGIGGFGPSVRDSLRDLADQFDDFDYRLTENVVVVEVAGQTVSARGQTAGDAIRKLAWIVAERKYREKDFAELDWTRIARTSCPSAVKPSGQSIIGRFPNIYPCGPFRWVRSLRIHARSFDPGTVCTLPLAVTSNTVSAVGIGRPEPRCFLAWV
jgi:hypothetical protein